MYVYSEYKNKFNEEIQEIQQMNEKLQVVKPSDNICRYDCEHSKS